MFKILNFINKNISNFVYAVSFFIDFIVIFSYTFGVHKDQLMVL